MERKTTHIPKIPTYSQNTQREVDSTIVANSLYFSTDLARIKVSHELERRPAG